MYGTLGFEVFCLTPTLFSLSNNIFDELQLKIPIPIKVNKVSFFIIT